MHFRRCAIHCFRTRNMWWLQPVCVPGVPDGVAAVVPDVASDVVPDGDTPCCCNCSQIVFAPGVCNKSLHVVFVNVMPTGVCRWCLQMVNT